ncbi:MAG: biotin transporter BioY, partial [Pseudomonadota bacterium]
MNLSVYQLLIRKHSLTWMQDAFLVFFGFLSLALLAQAKFYLPVSPVPITGQTFGVLLITFLFGARRGFFIVGRYLTLG